MEKTFEPRNFEKRLYEQWESAGYFIAHREENKKPFTIVMPPPNITGQLHIGHALDNAIQDAIIRFRRMQGYCALWLPGTDHASIATELKITEEMRAQGLEKARVGREKFLELAWDWKNKYGGRIEKQLRSLGSSCDWSRKAFTMDENLSRAVRHVFKILYDKGLVYRGDRITNMCVECGTALSDAEVEYETEEGRLWKFRYPFSDGTGFIEFATTRPETMLGDTAIAVNPDDERYVSVIGKTVKLPFGNREIPVIADEYVEKDFGTGAVKITPAHDPNDFEVGKRHDLEVRKIMTDKGIINSLGGEFEGQSRFECRKNIIEKMKQLGLFVSEEKYTHNVGHCHRCHTTVEPITSRQWFVSMKQLAQPAIEAVRSGEIEFIPEHFSKTYFHWMENIRDWCISRQLWWGHRIPVFYCDKCGLELCSENEEKICPECGAPLRQDEDVLDTWFSSALWPFSTLGYPEQTPDFEYFFPTDVLATGYDIITFWVSRMIFSSLEYTGKVPFRKVLIHGLVRDAQGRKMSKSLGNGIDPLEIVENYGADNLRFTLINGVAPGADTRFSTDKTNATRNFLNKLWNASRFVLMNTRSEIPSRLDINTLSPADKWILTRLNALIASVTDSMENYDLGIALAKLYDFTWSEFCDWYIELCKPVLYGTDENLKSAAITVLLYVLDKLLKMLHPFIPFITEEIYMSMPGHENTIMLQPYPLPEKEFDFPDMAELMENVKELVTKVRNQRAENNVPPSKRIRLLIKPASENLKETGVYIEKLCNAQLTFTNNPDHSGTLPIICRAGEAFIPLGDMLDIPKELNRLEKELNETENEISRASSKLSNPGFVSKAPPALVETEKEKLLSYQDKKQKISERIASLKQML